MVRYEEKLECYQNRLDLGFEVFFYIIYWLIREGAEEKRVVLIGMDSVALNTLYISQFDYFLFIIICRKNFYIVGGKKIPCKLFIHHSYKKFNEGLEHILERAKTYNFLLPNHPNHVFAE